VNFTFAGFAGRELNRPERVVAFFPERLRFTQRQRRHENRSDPERRQTLIGIDAPPELIPNGFALLDDCGFLVANMGDADGVWSISSQGIVHSWFSEVDGQQLTSAPISFLCTTKAPRLQSAHDAYCATCPSVERLLTDTSSASMRKAPAFVADGLCFANECRTALDGKYLYVSETFARRITRYQMLPHGALGNPKIFKTS
jgi:hypothetical protein